MVIVDIMISVWYLVTDLLIIQKWHSVCLLGELLRGFLQDLPHACHFSSS
ncbi:MAG: hypothetical protein ACFFE4_07255 [Candidatus Thorarchaeota archaeon]